MASTPASMFHIVTTGLQDLERLNPPKGKPTVQFYRSVFMKRTRWASQWRRVDFDNLADFGRKATVTLPQLGELISRVILVVDLPDIFTVQRQAYLASLPPFGAIQDPMLGPFWNWTNGLGNALCSTMELTIGDQVVDRLDSRLMEILDEQTQPVEHFDSTNILIYRNPSNYNDPLTSYIPPSDKQPITLEIIPPFWFNRGPGPQAFPIQALAKDKVQITVDFRPVQQCVYTDARIDSRNPPLSANQGVGPIPNIAGCGFFKRNDGEGVPISNMSKLINAFSEPPSNTFNGSLLSDITMPSAYHFQDAYWIVEYISLEDREASAFRQADLQIPIEQHVAVPPVETGGASSLRIALNEVGLVRDLTWVCQRVEADGYNAYFLFSRDLAPSGATGSYIPWWPDAVIPNWDYGDGIIQPAFMTRNSDPLTAATLWYRGARRFDNEAPSFFRALVPAQNCKRAPLIDRYIYRYDFGFWPTGGIANALTAPVDQVRGFSNWDKVTKKELELMVDNGGSCSADSWIPDPDQSAVTFTEATPLSEFVANFSSTTQAFQVTLLGSGDAANQGAGASVVGIFNYQQIRRLPNFRNVIARVVPGGSAALAIQTFDGTAFGYQWLAVAGSGGDGSPSYSGGNASSAVAVAQQGGGGPLTHDASYGSIPTLYSNYIIGYTTLNANGFSSPTYTVTTGGTITGWRILTSLPFSTAIANYIYINGVQTQGPFIGPGSGPNPIQWYTVTLAAPLTVNAGDLIYISHTQLGGFFYISAMNGPSGIAEITVNGVGVTLGGGGGGRLSTLGVGQPDGQRMEVTEAFVMSTQQTGGSTWGVQGGDGYTGGGSGFLAGGGGGSYVSRFMTQVTTEDGTNDGPASILVQPLVSVPAPKLNYNIYAWLTTYNILRITGGRGALLFSA